MNLIIKFMAEENTNPETNIMSKHDFYFETPLYEIVSLSELEKGVFGGDVDAYSSQNNSETTYSVYTQEIDTWINSHVTIGFYLIKLTCKRKQNDILRFTVYRDREIVLKIGQYPSLADLQFAEIGKKYDKVLPEEDLKNLKK